MTYTTEQKQPNMKALQKIESCEDELIAKLVQWPDLITTIPFDISIFKKWGYLVAEIINQSNRGLKPNVVTLSDAFPSNKELLAQLASMAQTCASPANYEYYLKELVRLTIDVQVYGSLRESLKLIASGEPAREVFGRCVNDALSMMSGNIPKYSYSSEEISKIFLDKIEADYENRNSMENKVKTGIPLVDKVIGAFLPTNMIIIGARPAVGKTACAVTMMLNMAKAGKRVGFISSEMSIAEISGRIVSQLSGVSSLKIRNNELAGDDWSKISKATKQLSELRLNICDKPSIKISEVVMQCRAWDISCGVDVVIIDYLTRIRPDKNSGNQNLDVGEIASQMKNLARNLNIPVIVLAQLNRDSQKRADKTPNMSDLRDSGIIEQEADCILLLHREQDEGTGADKNYIIVEKNRHGEAGTSLLVNFDKELMKWS